MALLDPYTGPWTQEEAAHLARRAGFAFRPAELTTLVGLGMSAAVDQFIDFADIETALEATIAGFPNDTTDHGRIKTPQTVQHLNGYWMYRMVHTSQPFQEQLALFLHDTLVSEYNKVSSGVPNQINTGNDGSTTGQQCTGGTVVPNASNQALTVARMMLDQNALFRTKGYGPYRQLLYKVTRDPAMLLYLDNFQNFNGRAQENYAREVMELFSMGVGNYSEQDVREVARAFTGETVDATCANNWPMSYFFKSSGHDNLSKTVFGQTFNQPSGGDTNFVLDLIIGRISNANITPFHSIYPAAAIFISWKILTWFVQESMPMSDPAVGELANFFWNNPVSGDGYHMRETLRKLLKSQLFYDLQYRWNMYKNGADFVAYALRGLQLEETSYTSSVYSALSLMGMALFAPPNVAGWPQGQAWINSSSIIARFNYGDRLSGTSILTDAYADGLKTQSFVSGNNDHNGMIEYFRARLIQQPLTAGETLALTTFLTGIGDATVGTPTQQAALYRKKIRGLVHLFLAMPKYQLK